VGDQVRLHGVIITARDAAHKYISESFIQAASVPPAERSTGAELRELWRNGALYHCGPVVARDPDGEWRFVSAGPTTSMREEPYEADLIAHFGLRAVVGKGGMGARTLAACQEHGAVYLHAVGGAATVIASTVRQVVKVYKLEEMGVPEAMWVIRVEGFPAVVTMDAHGGSLHTRVAQRSHRVLRRLLG
jgi:fumarate hydratase class I